MAERKKKAKVRKKAKRQKASQSNKSLSVKELKEEYPGRPKKCDCIPGGKACEDLEAKPGKYCKYCNADKKRNKKKRKGARNASTA